MQYCSTLSSTTNSASISTLHNNNNKILQCNIFQHCLQQPIHLLFHLYTTTTTTKYCNAKLFNIVFNNQFIFYFISTQQQQQQNIALQYCSTLSSTTKSSYISTLHNNNNNKRLQCYIVQHCLQQPIHLLFHLYTTTIKTKYCNAKLFNIVFNNQFIFYFISTQKQH